MRASLLRVVFSVTTSRQGLTWLFPAMAFCRCVQPAHKKDLRRIVVRECAVVQPKRISLVLPYRATTGIPLAGEIISHREAALPQLLVAASWLQLRTFLPLSKYTITIRDTSTEWIPHLSGKSQGQGDLTAWGRAAPQTFTAAAQG
ncbi:MAG: hypothetical protein LQ341_000940 [Variospora aurantia]|nr:MAG: hypothetical protein LQ341_000940 [Variospora aurantia]